MDTLVVNGKQEIIYSIDDFAELIERDMGSDAAEFFRKYDANVKAHYEYIFGNNGDLDAYESDLEYDQEMASKIRFKCEEMLTMFSKETGRNRVAALSPWAAKVKEIVKMTEEIER